jgi:hypothetical protein
VVTNGSIYFEDASGKICYSNYQNGNYQNRIVLPAMFNNGTTWGNPYVSPDEDYFIFNSTRTGGFGSTDLYISYKKNDGTWTNPKNLGNTINTSTAENGSEITDDGLYMTYVSNNDVYWVGTSFIDSLRHTNFAPYAINLIPNQTDTVGQLFNYTIPDSTFFDDDVTDTFTYTATKSNGTPLPSWLSIDSNTGTFIGTPTSTQVVNIKVIATDNAGATASTIFKITIIAPAAINQTIEQNKGFRIFPNPSNGLINISSYELLRKTTMLEISDLEGKVILKDKFINDINIDLTSKSKGIYVIKLITESDIFTSNICIE